jgi:hypothetical protein
MIYMLNRFSIENYRAFATKQNIEIRPLTLVFGWNSSGKSALVRFLPLLVESIRQDGPAIWLNGEVGRGATWSELVSKMTRRTTLKFGLSWSDSNSFEANWEVDGDLANKWQEARNISLRNFDTELTQIPENLSADWWQGFPEKFSSIDYSSSTLNIELHSKMKFLASNVQWISGIRAPLPRLANFNGGNPTPLKADGSNVFDHIIAAQMRSIQDPLLRAINVFFSAMGENLSFDNPFENNWRIMLRPAHAPEVRVNLCDAGEGYTQVLPVLLALARSTTDGPLQLCIEQPELHLHTRAQAELANVLVETVKSPRQPHILIETHSEVLLSSVQLAIAKGEISPEMVRVYWVESSSDGSSNTLAVDFDELGRPNDSTLVGAFKEALDIGRKLLSAQQSKISRIDKVD